MHADILVLTLISKQTMPNVQFIKWYFRNYAQPVDLFFISTVAMEKLEKSQNIFSVIEPLAEYFGKPNIIKVKENDLGDIKSCINEVIDKKEYTKVIANITGGTKLMSLGLFECCKNLPNTEIYYQPIEKKLQKIFPKYEEYNIDDIVTLEEYLKAHGITYERKNYEQIKDYAFNKNVCAAVVMSNKETIRCMCSMQNRAYFKNWKKNKPLNFKTIDESELATVDGSPIQRENICKVIKELGWDESLSYRQLRYITGGWFEEYVYQHIKNTCDIQDENIAINLKIKNRRTKEDVNELDVVFLDKNNRLHVIECKSFVENDESKILNDALYKLQAIIKTKFDLSVKSYLYTKSIVERESILCRAEDFGITIKDGNEI